MPIQSRRWIKLMIAAARFRNIAVHEYQTLQLPITVAIITQHLDDFTRFTRAILLKDLR